MSDKINIKKWVTQQALADELGVGVNTVNNWISRGKIKWMFLPGSSLILVKKDTISVNPKHHKSRKYTLPNTNMPEPASPID